MRATAAVLTALVLVVAACGGDRKGRDVPANDSALARDLTLAGAADSAQPQLRDVPDAKQTAPVVESKQPAAVEPKRVKQAPPPKREVPKPVPTTVATTTAPAPTPAPPPAAVVAPAAAPARRVGTIARGATFDAAADSRVCSTTSRPGDKLVARLASAVVGSDGVMFPAGSQAVIEIASVGSPTDSAGAPTFRVRSITANGETYDVSGDVVAAGAVERKRVDDGGMSDKKKVIGGAIAGAILGQMIGHNTKGTVIGAAAGAAAGTVAAVKGAKYEACWPAGTPLRVTLSAPVEIEIK